MKKMPFEVHNEIYNPSQITEVLQMAVNEKTYNVQIKAKRCTMFRVRLT